MNAGQKLLTAVVGVACLSSIDARIVAAQPDPNAPPPPDPNGQPPQPDPNAPPNGQPYQPDPNAPPPNGFDPNAPQPPPPGLSLARWPLEIIQRPLTLRTGLIRAQGDLGISQLTVMGSSATGIGLTASGGYGVSDQFEIGAAYSLSLKEFEAKGALSAFINYQLADGPFKAAFTGAFTYNLLGETGAFGVGLALQYNLSPKFAVFIPGNQLTATAIVQDMAARPVTLSLPLGLELQASPNLLVYAQTSFGTVNISDSESVFIGDVQPLTLGGFYSPSNEIDIGAAVQFPNLKNAGDLFVILITGRIFVSN